MTTTNRRLPTEVAHDRLMARRAVAAVNAQSADPARAEMAGIELAEIDRRLKLL